MQEVSVIIPNYNGMAYLEGVLSSLEQQEFQNFETILVDNGSSDGSVAFTMGNYPWVHIIEPVSYTHLLIRTTCIVLIISVILWL